jgi:peptidoglycan/xylan/chitin deacetylase (PgdA/CDA1 family)
MLKKISWVFFLIIMLASCTCKSNNKKMESKNNNYPKPDKLCALTFDDGPDPVKTALVLNKLEEHGVVATFFMVGQRINDSTKPVIQRLVNMHNEIGNHSWSFASMTDMTEAEIKKSIDDTTSAIQTYAGVTPVFFRPPNLAVNDKMHKVINLVFAEGILGYDWDGCNTTAQQRADNILNGGMKDGAIILLHDVQPDPHPTPEALDIIIPELKKRGYEFVTLSELFKRKGITLDKAKNKMWKFVE